MKGPFNGSDFWTVIQDRFVSSPFFLDIRDHDDRGFDARPGR
jgi:hypothetical protein